MNEEYIYIFRWVNLFWLIVNLIWLVYMGVAYYITNRKKSWFGVALVIWICYGMYSVIEVIILNIPPSPRAYIFMLCNILTSYCAWKVRSELRSEASSG